MHRLLESLGSMDASKPLYLGDFVDRPTSHNTAHWPEFACGGSGTVLSRTAVLLTNFSACVAVLRAPLP